MRLAISVFCLVAQTATAIGQPGSNASASVDRISARYSVIPNVEYAGAANHEAKLDLFLPRDVGPDGAVPTVIFFHGGGWTGGDKAAGVTQILPYLEMGWAVVNVNYRLGRAPVAVEDARCAVRWVMQNAPRYRFDGGKLVVTGESAGSHLALMAGMLTSSDGFDGMCPGSESTRVAAIISWYGATNVSELVEPPNQQPYALRWLDGLPNAPEMARRLSPVRYVRPGLPAVITIHGNADVTAPYEQAVRFHTALDSARVPNQLVTIPGRGHGDFTPDEWIGGRAAIRQFLARQGLTRR
jgi:acetyl esterase/lipase